MIDERRDGPDEKIPGVVIGLVSAVAGDPDDLARVRVRFPTLQVDSAWARVASFYAGPGKGAVFAPAIDDEVLIAFEAGDVARPYVIGVLWNGVDTPPVATGAMADVRSITTASGAHLTFDDTPGKARITIADAAGNAIVIDGAANKITLDSTMDIALTASAGEITIAGGKVTISASEALRVSSAGDAALSASGEMSLSGAMIQLN